MKKQFKPGETAPVFAFYELIGRCGGHTERSGP